MQFERDEFNQIWNFPHNPYNPFRPPLSGKSLVATSSALEQLSQGLSQWQQKRRISRISRKFLVFSVVYAVGFAVVFCVLFFFSCSSQSVIWFRPLFLLLMFVFCVSFFFSLAPLSYSSSYILSELLPLTKNNAFTFWGWCNHCLASLGRFFFKSKPLSFCGNPVFVFRTKLFHRNRLQLFINCDFTNTFVVSTETADFTEFTDLCWKPHQYL